MIPLPHVISLRPTESLADRPGALKKSLRFEGCGVN
jgi:hypothetical protein